MSTMSRPRSEVSRGGYSSIDDSSDNFNSIKSLDIESDNSGSEDNVDEESQILLAKAFMAMIGIGYLFPFSALTQPVDYWHELFPDFNIEFPLTAVFFCVNLLFLFAIVFFSGDQPNFQFRIVGGFIGQLLILLLIPMLPYINLPSETLHYQIVLIATAIVAIFTALLDSVVIGFASMYPAKVLEGLQIGIGLSSLIGSVYRILTKLIFPPEDVILSSLIYFFTGAVTIVCCIISYYMLVNLPISKKYLRHNLAKQLQNDQKAKDSNHTKSEVTPLTTHPSDDSFVATNSENDTFASRVQILRTVAFHQFLVLVVYMTSLSVFPALITEIPTYNFPLLQVSRWWSLLLLLFFCILDTWGRFLTSYRLGMTHENVHWYVLVRILLFPCLYGCLKGTPSFLQEDAFALLFVGLLGFTNGHMGSICIMMVTEQVKEENKSLVGGFTGFALNVGLVLGSMFALLVDKLLIVH